LASEQISTQPHQANASLTHVTRSQRQSRAWAQQARKQASVTAISTSATPCACIRNSGIASTDPAAIRGRVSPCRAAKSVRRAIGRFLPAAGRDGKPCRSECRADQLERPRHGRLPDCCPVTRKNSLLGAGRGTTPREPEAHQADRLLCAAAAWPGNAGDG